MKPELDYSIKEECEILINNYFSKDSANEKSFFNVEVKHNKSWNEDLNLQKKLTKDIFDQLLVYIHIHYIVYYYIIFKSLLIP